MATNNDDLYATENKKDEKTVVLAIRVPKSVRDDFNKLCESKGVEVSKVLRRFIERELKNNQQ